LLSYPDQCAEDDVLGLALDHFENRGALNLPLSDEPREHRRLHDPQANPEPDRHQNEAQGERQAPTPREELVTRHLAEGNNREVGEEQTAGHAELRPRRDEAARMVGARPFHRQQHRAAPLAADADTLDEAQDRENHRAPDADGLIGGHERNQERRDPHQHERRDQRRYAADAVAVVPEERRADRAGNEANRIYADGLERSRTGMRVSEGT